MVSQYFSVEGMVGSSLASQTLFTLLTLCVSCIETGVAMCGRESKERESGVMQYNDRCHSATNELEIFMIFIHQA